jgi:hypothetical protein
MRDVYEIAYLFGGPRRVAMAALVALHEDDQITISSARHRVEAVRRAPREPVETAALEAIPRWGKVLRPALRAIADTAAVEDIGRRLRRDRLLPSSHLSALWQWGRIPAFRRLRLRRRLISDPETGGLTRVAVMGTAEIADSRLRKIFETPDPPPAIRAPKMRVAGPVDPFYENNAPDRSGALATLLP